MLSEKEQKRLIDRFYESWRKRNNLPASRSKWSFKERDEYRVASAQYIADRPNVFSEFRVRTAFKNLDVPARVIDDYTFGERITDFFPAFADEAENINPFSSENRGKTVLYIVGGVVLTVVASRLVDNLTKGS